MIVGSVESWGPLAKVLRETPGVELLGAVSDTDVDCSVAGVVELVEQLKVERLVVVPHAGWGERGSIKLIQSSKWLGLRVSLMLTDMAAVGSAGTLDQLDSTLLLGRAAVRVVSVLGGVEALVRCRRCVTGYFVRGAGIRIDCTRRQAGQ